MRKTGFRKKLRACIALSCLISMVSVNFMSVLATDDVDKLEKETSNLESELSSLQSELSSLSSRINNLTEKIDSTNEKIKKTELDLVAAKLNEEMQYDAMKKRIKFMYETGNPSFIEMICDSETMTEFLNKTEFVQTITEYDKDLLEELKEIRVDIAEKEETLEKEKNDLEELEAELRTEESSLNSAISSTSSKLKSSSQALKEAKKAQAAAKEALKESSSNSSSSSSSKDTSNKNTSSDSSDKTPSSNESSSSTNSSNDLVLFAALLQCEAGTSNYNSLLAVATVIMNRVESSRFPNSIRGVIYQSGQFSPTWNGSLKRVLAKGPCNLAYQVAQDAMNGKRLTKVNNCHYFNASWATNKKGVNVGGNIFW